MEAFWINFWPSFWATVAGAIVISALYFIFNDKCFSLPNLNGSWYIETTTVNTAYNPFQGMKLHYHVLIFQEGNRITGSGEKIYEVSLNGTREYVGTHRVHITIQGFVNKFYLSPDRINIHYYEDGEKRRSSTFQQLDYEKFGKSETFHGSFSTTIADQSGTVTWSRKPIKRPDSV